MRTLAPSAGLHEFGRVAFRGGRRPACGRAGLGPVLDAQPQIKQLGQDGCIPPAIDVETTFPIIRHAVTAWLRNLFGVYATQVGLGTDVGGLYTAKVTIDSK